MKNNYEPTEYDIEQSDHDAEIYDKYLKERIGGFESFDHWKNEIPNIIFKFKSLNNEEQLGYVKEILQDYKIFMSPRIILNDPFEGENVDYLSDNDKTVYEGMIKRCRILSLSKNCFSAPLWAHYANKCSGICVGFNTFKAFDCLTKIIYTNTIDKKQWWTVDKKAAAMYEYIYKHTDWSYEEEYRIVKESEQNEHAKVYFEYNVSDISLVIFGEKIKAEYKKELLEILPSSCLKFDVKPDRNRSRYYLVECDTTAPPIYELEELYKRVFKLGDSK